MSEEAPGNPGAVAWPDDYTAGVVVRRMQAKLHRWAGEDPSRRFGDLFNLVYDQAFLVHAWERASTNKGAKTAGIDKATVAMIETWVGVEQFLGQIRDSLKSGGFQPGRGPQDLQAAGSMLSRLVIGMTGSVLAPASVILLTVGARPSRDVGLVTVGGIGLCFLRRLLMRVIIQILRD